MLCQHSADRLRIKNYTCSISREHGNKLISDNIFILLITQGHGCVQYYNS